MKRTKKITIGCFTVLFLLVICYESRIQISIKREAEKGLALIQEEGGRIFGAGGELCVLNHDTRRWDTVMPTSYRYENPQEMVVTSTTLVYTDSRDDKVKMCPIDDLDSKMILDAIPFVKYALSHNERRLAYSAGHDSSYSRECLTILDIRTGEKTVCPGIAGGESVMSWTLDDTAIVVSCSLPFNNSITRFDISENEITKITKGYFAKVLPGNTLGFWRNEDSDAVCYKMNLETKCEEELFRTKHFLLGADWDPTGRFVVAFASAGIHGFLFIPTGGGLPLLWDTKTGLRYKLPPTTGVLSGGFKSGCIFWVKKEPE